MSMHCYTPTTVSNHKRTCDAWISIHGNVYDITNFITAHPGGEEVLIESAGTDATLCFDSIGHSDEAYKLMNDLKIGKLSSKYEKRAESTVAARPTTIRPLAEFPWKGEWEDHIKGSSKDRIFSVP